MSNSDTPQLATTQEERSRCLADMADAEYGKLMNFDISFSLVRMLIVDVEKLLSVVVAKDAELLQSRAQVARLREFLDGMIEEMERYPYEALSYAKTIIDELLASLPDQSARDAAVLRAAEWVSNHHKRSADKTFECQCVVCQAVRGDKKVDTSD